MPGVFKDKVSYQSLALAADYLTGPRQFNITKLAIAGQGFALNGTAGITLNLNFVATTGTPPSITTQPTNATRLRQNKRATTRHAD